MNKKYTRSKRDNKKEAHPGVLVSYWKGLNKLLLLAVLLCSVLSATMLYSIWQNGILSSVDDSQFRTQISASLIGLAGALILAAIDYHKVVRLWFVFAPIALILTLLCFTSLGVKRDGTDDQAWLNLGIIQFQPSEILKLAFIMTFALHLAKDEKNINKPLHMLLLCIHGAVPTAIIALQKDYGTAIVFAVVFLGMLFSARVNLKYYLAFIIAIPTVLVLIWNFILDDIHKNRILVLLNPGTDPKGLEYQQDLGLKALANGNIFGIGLNTDADSYVSVPELHNDFIFAQVGQTLGFVGAMALVAVLAFICLKVLYNSYRCKDKLGMFICVGVFSMLFIHCFMNIGMVLKVAPVIGIPLPFVSAGGTATISMYVAIGLVISTYIHNQKRYIVFS